MALYDEVHGSAGDRRLSVMREQRVSRGLSWWCGSGGRGCRSGGWRRRWRRRRRRRPDGRSYRGAGGRNRGPVNFVVQQGLDDRRVMGRQRDRPRRCSDHGRRRLFTLGRHVARYVRGRR